MCGDDRIRYDQPLRSVHVTNYYHECSGGVKTNYDRLLQAANRHRRYVSLIVPGEVEDVVNIGDYGKIYHVEAKPAPIFDKRYRLMLPWHFLLEDSPIRRILLNEKPDIIEIYDNYALTFLAGMIRTGHFSQLKRPMLVYFTGERFDTIFQTFVAGGKFGKWFSRRLMGNYNLPMFDNYIANSDFVAAELYESVENGDNPGRSKWFFDKCWKILNAAPEPFEDRVAVCPRGVDTDFFTPKRRSEETRKRICKSAGVPDTAELVLSSTRLSPEKNVELLPAIMDDLSKDAELDFRFLVAGAGPKEDWLREETLKRFPGKLVLLGHLEKDDLADHYANVDVFVHPNPREPFGNVGLEAMASGAAMVVSNTGGVTTYADEQNARTVPANAVDFANAIRESVKDRELTKKKILEALKTANRFSQVAAVDNLLALYDRMYEAFAKPSSVEAGESNMALTAAV